ncbi:MAG: glucosyl-3-phosphoglycerate synthase, partial [Actinomycetota bacterium]|nr:glucosyl-3-phosphoglycerate synthase [Actinomycetota bacterium]
MSERPPYAVVGDWLERRSFEAREFPLGRLLDVKTATISSVVPARDVAPTIGPIVDVLVSLKAAGLLDEVVVVDAASSDGTGAVAAAHGAEVFQESELLAEHGPALGKGDAMWRGVSATSGDIVVFVDGDTENFDDRFILGLVGPLLIDPSIALVKGAFRRPLRVGSEVLHDGGGRVTELVARPLINLYFPSLAGFVQPLAGEIAARRDLLEDLRFPVGYGVEIAMLVDAFSSVGLDALAQTDVGERRDPHQHLHSLTSMAYGVMVA